MAFTAEPALKNKPAQTSVEQKVDTTSSQQIKEIEIPETETFQENFDSSSGESFAINLARQRALKLLEEYDQETDSQKKLQIIWRLGLLRLPLPEVMAKMAEFLSTNDIQTVVSALRALVKIGNPGAQICGPDIINLLGNDEFVIKWSAITALENLPILPGRAIPRLFKIYRNEKRAARQGIIIRTLNGYGPTGIAVLQKMLEDATGPNKRPIAEVISILTGENVETILRDS
jgi:HEAT repeat protein